MFDEDTDLGKKPKPNVPIGGQTEMFDDVNLGITPTSRTIREKDPRQGELFGIDDTQLGLFDREDAPKQLTDQRISQLMAPSAAETAISMRDTRGDVPIQMDKKGPLPRIKTVQDQTNELLSKAEELRGIIRSGEEAKKTAINPAMVEPL